jgi:hypothetical protein
MMDGGWTSFTVTLKLHDDVSRALSVAVQVTAVDVAPENCEPEAGRQEMPRIPELSVALALYDTVAKLLPASGLRTIGAGHVMAGAVVSATVTVKVHVACRL